MSRGEAKRMAATTCMCAGSGDRVARVCGLTVVAADERVIIVGLISFKNAVVASSMRIDGGSLAAELGR